MRRSAFTVIELLISIAVIGLLVALLLPALGASREAARQTQCRNNLRQIGVAVHHHESQYRHFPTNGWGFAWLGDADRGAGLRQPGGWIYNLLPFLEQAQLRNLAKGPPGAARNDAVEEMCTRVSPVFRCPTRNAPIHGPMTEDFTIRNGPPLLHVARTDYAICEGDYITDTPGGPDTLEEGDSRTYMWTDVSRASGVSYLRSQVSAAEIADGLSHTLLVGEKYVSRRGYSTADDDGHDQCLYCGVDLDISRWTIEQPYQDGDDIHLREFGSAHPGGFNAVLCDGSVHTISYLIDGDVYIHLGNRRDGGPSSF